MYQIRERIKQESGGQLFEDSAEAVRLLALAEHEGCDLWTADNKMYQAVKDTFSWVHTIKDYSNNIPL